MDKYLRSSSDNFSYLLEMTEDEEKPKCTWMSIG